MTTSDKAADILKKMTEIHEQSKDCKWEITMKEGQCGDGMIITKNAKGNIQSIELVEAAVDKLLDVDLNGYEGQLHEFCVDVFSILRNLRVRIVIDFCMWDVQISTRVWCVVNDIEYSVMAMTPTFDELDLQRWHPALDATHITRQLIRALSVEMFIDKEKEQGVDEKHSPHYEAIWSKIDKGIKNDEEE